ncbi:MAG: hypothetical protein F4X44_08240 [Gammaproteobacteria bacterium]|nr:hypothetical protein [Gammaproteobacteria bacterium]MYD80586.1 hypothetical protein [Gammaproteobacteria bacterium]
MDEYFENLPLESSDTTWISLPNRLTYGRVFKNPELDRNRVLQALEETQCRLEDGETVRWDLSQSCKADAFANLSVFLWTCDKHSNSARPADYSVDMSEDADLEFSRPEYYKRILHRTIVRILENHWLRNKCSGYELSEMRFDATRDQKQYELLRSIAERLGEDRFPSDAPTETFVLKSLAARLGDLSTAVIYYETPSQRKADDSWSNHMNSVWPWRNTLREIDETTRNRAILLPDKVRYLLRMGISIAISLQESGLEFDWDHLVRMVCAPQKTEEAICKTAIEERKLTFEWDQKSEMETIEKIETVARELGLYD